MLCLFLTAGTAVPAFAMETEDELNISFFSSGIDPNDVEEPSKAVQHALQRFVSKYDNDQERARLEANSWTALANSFFGGIVSNIGSVLTFVNGSITLLKTLGDIGEALPREPKTSVDSVPVEYSVTIPSEYISANFDELSALTADNCTDKLAEALEKGVYEAAQDKKLSAYGGFDTEWSYLSEDEKHETAKQFAADLTDSLAFACAYNAANERVTLNPVADDGYAFKSYITKPAVEITDNSFVMPESGITVKAVFSRIGSITVKDCENCTVTHSRSLSVSGEKITLRIVPDEGMEFGKWKIVEDEDGFKVYAVYTPIPYSPIEAKINVASAKSADYHSKVIIRATAYGVPDGGYLVMTVNGKEINGTAEDVSYEIEEISEDVNYSVKIVDADGKVLKNADGIELKKDGGIITCKAGFIQKLIAFFRSLFNALPVIEVKP